MRLSIIALLVAGCPGGGGGGYRPPPGGQSGACDPFGPNFVEATSSSLAISQLLVDGLAVFPGFNPTLTCVPSEGSGGGWTFPDSMGDFGNITNTASSTGSQSIDANNFVIDLFGHSPPLVFTGADFSSSNYTVNQIDPFNVTFSGTATNSTSHTLVIQYEATATP